MHLIAHTHTHTHAYPPTSHTHPTHALPPTPTHIHTHTHALPPTLHTCTELDRGTGEIIARRKEKPSQAAVVAVVVE